MRDVVLLDKTNYSCGLMYIMRVFIYYLFIMEQVDFDVILGRLYLDTTDVLRS